MTKILILHGPNINLIGKREPQVYGHLTFAEIEKQLSATATKLGLDIISSQHNSESGLIDAIGQAPNQKVQLIIINPAALTHTSIAVRDALLAAQLPVIEVHISNVFKRDNFRHHSFISDIAVGVVCGFGSDSYSLALQAASNILK